MATYQQIAGRNGCGPSCLMVAASEHGVMPVPLNNANERIIHAACGFQNQGNNPYSSPVFLADYARTQLGFNNARVVLSGQIFRRYLLQLYPGELVQAQQRNIQVDYWTGWSPRYSYSRDWVLMVTLCVDYTPAGALVGLGGGGAGVWRGLAVGAGAGVGAGLASAAAVGTGLSVYDLIRSIRSGHTSLHYVLYRGATYMDPADGRDYWFFNRMGGRNNAYWDTGCYVILR